MSDILIVEDEVVLARSIVSYLERRGFSAEYAVDSASARAQFQRMAPRLVILDYKLNEDNGLDLLDWMRASDPRVNVVIMTGHGDIEVAVRAMKAGARDFLVKPAPLGTIAAMAGELMLDELAGGLDRRGADRIVGRSSAANELRATIRKLAAPQPGGRRPGVLIMGPRGSGKTLAATALHEEAAPEGRLATLDALLEPDASADRIRDLVAEATGGTLLIRHVGALDRQAQSRVLTATSIADVSLIATSETHVVAGGDAFLPELLYRIQVGWIDVPPLSEHAVDVLPIADIAARRIARQRGSARPRFTPEARAKLLEQDWPGNVAELINCIERAMILQKDDVIDGGDIRPITGTGRDESAIPTLKELELGAIRSALSRTGGNVSRAAELLGISRDTLRYRMEKFELSRH